MKYSNSKTTSTIDVTPSTLRKRAEKLRKQATGIGLKIERIKAKIEGRIKEYTSWRNVLAEKAAAQHEAVLADDGVRSAIGKKGAATRALNAAKKANDGKAYAEAERKLAMADMALAETKERRAKAEQRLADIEAGLEADRNFFVAQERAKETEAVEPLMAEMDRVLSESLDLEAKADAMVKVRITGTDGVCWATWAADESEARKIGNDAVIVARNNGGLVKVELFDSTGVSFAAHTNAKAIKTSKTELTPSAVFGKGVQDAIAAKRRTKLMHADEQRTGIPQAPAWEVTVVDDDMTVLVGKTYGKDEADEAREVYERAVPYGPVVLLKDGQVYETNVPAFNRMKHSLATVRKFRVTPNGLVPMESIRKMVSPTMNYIAGLTGNPVGQDIVMVEAAISGFDSEDEAVLASADAAKQVLADTVHGLRLDGVVYRPYGHGTNKAKDGVLSFCPSSIVSRVRKYQNAGAQAQWEIGPAKFCAYNGLADVAVKEFINILNVNVTPEDAAIFKTLTTTVSDPNGIVQFDAKGVETWLDSLEQKCSDGSAILSMTEEWMAAHVADEAEREKVREAYEALAGHSFRMPLMKGYLTVVPVGGLHQFARFLGEELDPMKILFVDETVMKGGFGPTGSHASMEELAANFSSLGCVSGLLLKAHLPSEQELGMLSAQAWRGLLGISRQTMRLLWDDEKERVMNITAGRIIGGALGKLVDEVDGYEKLPAVQRYVQSRKVELLRESAQSRFHGLTLNLAGNGDIFRWTAAQFGKEFVAIPAYTVVCRGLELREEGQEVVIGRSPCFGLCVVKAYSSFEALYVATGRDAKIGRFLDSITKEDGTLFFSSEDDVVTRLQGDFDGDHFFLIADEHFVAAVKEAHAVNPMPYFCSEPAKKPAKRPVTEEILEEYFVNICHTPNVGKWDNGFAKLIGSLPFDHKLTAEEILSLGQAMDRFQNDVDAGKHSSDGNVNNWKLQPSLARAMAKDTEMPRGLWLMKNEREPQRYHGKGAAKLGMGIWDVIRNVASRELAEAEKALRMPLPEDDTELEKLIVPGAAVNADIFHFVGKHHFRFFREVKGELEYQPVDILVYDDEEEALSSMDNKGLFHKVGKLSKSHGDRVSYYAGIARADGTMPVVTYDGKALTEVAGKWVCNEEKTPFLFMQSARITEALRWMQGDPEQAARYGWLRNDMRKAARIACAAYAAMYGYGIRDAAQKAFRYAFTKAAGCNLFELRHVCDTFEPELREALQARREAMADNSVVEWYPEEIGDIA